MESEKLNNDIKSFDRFCSDIYNWHKDSEMKKEFYRLYEADKGFEIMNKNSILIMLKWNLFFRWEPLHLFGIHIIK